MDGKGAVCFRAGLHGSGTKAWGEMYHVCLPVYYAQEGQATSHNQQNIQGVGGEEWLGCCTTQGREEGVIEKPTLLFSLSLSLRELCQAA